MATSTITDSTFATTGILASEYLLVNFGVASWDGITRGIIASLWFTWHLTLCFNLGNQRQPDYVKEDAINKPWRPVPAGRITPERTLCWQLFAIASLFLLCFTIFGAWQEVLLYVSCTLLYNELGWADKSWWQRTLLNILGLTMNRAASLRIAAGAAQGFGTEVAFTPKMLCWLVICALVIGTTLQVQDLRDQEGDAQIGRRTIPLVVGDVETRWATASAVLFWSVACPFYWKLGLVGYMIEGGVAMAVAAHVLFCRDPRSDHLNFRYVAAWWVFLYFLPVMKRAGL